MPDGSISKNDVCEQSTEPLNQTAQTLFDECKFYTENIESDLTMNEIQIKNYKINQTTYIISCSPISIDLTTDMDSKEREMAQLWTICLVFKEDGILEII
jgi:hypothetical protein